MKKFLAGAVCLMIAVAFVVAPVQAKEKGGAGPAILSFILPGVGEWSNNDYQGPFPFGECIVGALCCPFWISSIIDAASGASDTNMRFDFWTAPK